MASSRPGDLAISVDAPRRRFPALTATFVTALYAIGYLVWERNDWGTPQIRNLVSNVAFMPLNLSVLTLFALAVYQGPELWRRLRAAWKDGRRSRSAPARI